MSRLGIVALFCALLAVAFAATWAASVGSTLSLAAFLVTFAFAGPAALLGFISWQWAALDPEVRIRWPAGVALALTLAALVIVFARFSTIELD